MKMLRNKKGFSLIELVVAMAILSTLVFVASSVYEPAADTSKETVLITNCGKVKSLIEIELIEKDADTVMLEMDALIEKADIVNVFANPHYYQIANGTMENIGEVLATKEGEDYFLIRGVTAPLEPPIPDPPLRARF